MNLRRAVRELRGARSSRALVAASRRNELSCAWIAQTLIALIAGTVLKSPRRRDAFANARDERAPRKSLTRAFTFVEVLAAMVFLGILMPVVINALLTANRAAVVAERSTIAAQLGENKLGELMLGDAWSSANTSGDFGRAWSGYRWQLSKPTWQNGAMTELTLVVLYKVQGVERDARLATLVSPSLTAASSTNGSTTTP